jgi:hypothetical protein
MSGYRMTPLNVTSVTERNDLITAFGAVAAWQATITQLRIREAKVTDRRRKMELRLQLLNAENQLRLAIDAHNQGE